MTDQLPWIITSDLDLVVLITSSVGSDGSQGKQIMTVSEVFAYITRTMGATEAVMLDHNVTPMRQENGLLKCSQLFEIFHGPNLQTSFKTDIVFEPVLVTLFCRKEVKLQDLSDTRSLQRGKSIASSQRHLRAT